MKPGQVLALTCANIYIDDNLDQAHSRPPSRPLLKQPSRLAGTQIIDRDVSSCVWVWAASACVQLQGDKLERPSHSGIGTVDTILSLASMLTASSWFSLKLPLS